MSNGESMSAWDWANGLGAVAAIICAFAGYDQGGWIGAIIAAGLAFGVWRRSSDVRRDRAGLPPRHWRGHFTGHPVRSEQPLPMAGRAVPMSRRRTWGIAGKNRAFAVVAVLLVVGVSIQASAKTFKSADFLKWGTESQSFYIDTSIGMAGLIASLNDEHQSRCIDNWYFQDKSGAEDKILNAMRRNPDYHPRGVIVAVLQDVCGPLTYGGQ